MRLVDLTGIVMLGLLACSESAGEPAAEPPASSTPGDPPRLGCPPGSAAFGRGLCEPAGVPAEACGDGFEADGSFGCAPILPAASCRPGEIALPGDARCAPLAPCPADTYGDGPTDASTEHVDDSYAGTDSDGSSERPWPTIQKGIEAAAAGAVVAIAGGEYPEALLVEKPVHLRGRCPSAVRVTSTTNAAAVRVRQAGGTRIEGLTLAGPGVALAIEQSDMVSVEAVHVDQPGKQAIYLPEGGELATVVLRRVLIDLAPGNTGLAVFGHAVDAEAMVVRSTVQDANGAIAIQLRGDSAGRPAQLSLARSVLGELAGRGLVASGAEVTIDGTVFRASSAPGAQERIAVSVGGDGLPATLALAHSVVEGAHDRAIVGWGATLALTHVTVREARTAGIYCDLGPAWELGTVELDASLVGDVECAGIFAAGCAVALRSSRVRDVSAGTGLLMPGVANGAGIIYGGFGFELTDEGILLEGSGELLSLDDSVVSGTTAQGIALANADAILEHTLVEHIRESPLGLDGHGLGVMGVVGFPGSGEPHVVVHDSSIGDNEGAGIASFGASVSLSDNQLRCNRWPLNAAPSGDFSRFLAQVGIVPAPPFGAVDATFDGAYDHNVCGCDDETACKQTGETVTPPFALQ